MKKLAPSLDGIPGLGVMKCTHVWTPQPTTQFCRQLSVLLANSRFLATPWVDTGSLLHSWKDRLKNQVRADPEAGYPRGASCLGLGGSLLPQCLADHYHRIPGIARQLPLRSEKTGEETVSSDSLSGPWVVRGVVRMCSVQVGGARADKLPLHTPSHADVKGAGSHAGPGRQP
ncbi:uncharacterized protein LOC117802654 isoform X2 [Ailuropoda melanoleuca]|uniref:uncharacterized protein LOC117802654 isoform X2 n=1 Tax=Ailuropoda melanoleuca TaxID=9646 RepID=UPI0014945604|nr:uncharacterized protein LOC117802654 isoform X2 [Ailuropoda melanoleuca]